MKKVLSAVCLMLVAVSPADTDEPAPRTLSVTGTAEVNVAPDICYMTLVVTVDRKKNAAQAYSENNATAIAIADAVKAIGIEPKDIQTQGFSITPEYRYDDDSHRRHFEGYTVSHTLSVKVRDLAKVSPVLDAAVGAGATEVSSVNFTVENPKRYLADARVEAIKAARAKAETIAQTAGVQLLRPLSISEYEPSGWQHMYAQSNVQMRDTDWAGTGASLEPGQVRLSHSVSISYEIK